LHRVVHRPQANDYDSPAVPDVLIYADTIRSPEMRHEVAIVVPDPFLYVEHDGSRHTVSTSFEVARIAALPAGPQAHALEEFGFDELVASGIPREEVDLAVAVNACKALGVESAAVPPSFPLALAERLREAGVELRVDRDTFSTRRRVKSESQLAGIRRAQRAAEAGMDAARDLLRRAHSNGNGLVVDGESLTVERVKQAMQRAFLAHGVATDEFIVAPGAQGAMGHEMGHGPISAGVPLVIDVWPKDPETGCYADMTRTYVVGDPPAEIVEYHRLVKEALDRSIAATRAGVPGIEVFRLVCDVFQAAGYPTQLTKAPGEVLESGFFHGLGHGVGLEVHEPPWLGRAPGELVAGDVVTLEPGLYRQGFGGVRLEDLVLVTDEGAENLTDYPYDLEP
jgi:Xaa-Pro aminopeptidase